MNNDAFAALHTSSGKACRVQDAVALGRRIAWLTATDKILSGISCAVSGAGS